MRLTRAQLAALRNVRDHGDIGHNKSRKSLDRIEKNRRVNGGFMVTRIALLRRGLIDWRNEITQAGLNAIKDR